jgi:TRAP-type C4-dicarboxylate transport system substrate-binding protein
MMRPQTLPLLLVALAAGFPAGAAGQAATQRIRLGTLAPQGSSYHRILQEMGEKWRLAANGGVQLVVYAGGTMGNEAELVRRMRLGQLQAATITVTGLRELDPAVTALQEMPMMFRTLDEVEYVRSRLEPALARYMAEKGFVVLFWADAGWVRYFARKPALRPDDFKSMKTFVTAGDTKHFDLLKSAGHAPVALDWSDALTSLQTGLIDVIPTIPYYALAGQFYTVAGHMLELNWVPLVGATIVSKRTWDALPAATRARFGDAAAEAGRQFQAAGRKESDEAVAAMRSRGLVVVPVSPAVAAEWRALAETFYPRIRGSMVPADMVDEVTRLLTQYRSSSPPE